MVLREAWPQADVHFAGVTNELGPSSLFRLVAAHDTVAWLLRVLRIVILGQRVSCLGSSACPVWLLFGRQSRQQLMHELLAEV